MSTYEVPLNHLQRKQLICRLLLKKYPIYKRYYIYIKKIIYIYIKDTIYIYI